MEQFKLNYGNLTKLKQLSIVLLVAFLSILAGATSSVLYLIAIAAIIGLLLFLIQPEFGIIAIIAGGLIVPLQISTGTETNINLVILFIPLLVFLFGLRMIVEHRALDTITTLPMLALMGFISAVFLAFLAGQVGWVPMQPASLAAQMGGIAVFLFSALACFLVAEQVRDIVWLERITWSFLIIAGLFFGTRFIPNGGGIDGLFTREATGSLLWVWFVSLGFSQAILNKDLKLPWRIMLLSLVIGALYVALFRVRVWTSGWMPPLVALATILIIARPRLGIPVFLIAVAFMATEFDTLRNDAINFSGDEWSYITRLEAWKGIWELIQINPILGLGPSNYYWYTPIVKILGYQVNFSSHNQYIDIIAQIGFLGFGFFVWFMWEVSRLGWQLRRKVTTGFQRAFVVGTLGGIAGTLVAGMLGDWVLPFVYNLGLSGMRASILAWIFMGGLVALSRILLRSETPQPSSLT